MNWKKITAIMFCLLAPASGWAEEEKTQKPGAPGFWRPDDTSEKPGPGKFAKLRFLTTSGYPPFNYRDANKTISGFNIDLLNALCKELGIKCTLETVVWKSLIPLLNQGKGDAIIAGMSVSQENLRKASFTRPYFRTPARFVVKKDSKLKDFSPKGLVNKRIGVINNTAHEAYIKNIFPKTDFIPWPDAEKARQALQEGHIAALFGDGVKLSYWIKGKSSKDCCEFRGGSYTESHFFGSGMAIAVTRGNVKLVELLNYGLARLYEKGKYAELVSKHFPLPLYAVK